MRGYEQQYLSLLLDVLANGEHREDRTGTGTLAVFGRQIRIDLQQGFPVLTTKKLHLKSIWHELLWFLRAETNIKYMQENGVRIWDEWADGDGEVGPMYGVQWRRWFNGIEAMKEDPDYNNYYIDQLHRVIVGIKQNPTSRRLVVSAWNVSQLDEMALPPCHIMFQFFVRKGRYLDCLVYQRSADMFLGVPFDIASYATLMHMVAIVTDLHVGELIYNFGDTHIYMNHMDQVHLQLTREHRPLPYLVVKRLTQDIDNFQFDDFELRGYDPHPAIKARVSV